MDLILLGCNYKIENAEFTKDCKLKFIL